MEPQPTKPIIVIVGETASGKTKLATSLAQKFNGEIICADSWTVRREVNIGTAKPSAEEQKLAPHHLLDVVEPCDDFTAAVFKDLANQAIKNISERGRLPILVGGTGLYIDGVIFDFSFLPEGDREAREKLNSLPREELIGLAYQRKLSTEGIDTNNKRRIIRLIETSGAVPKRQTLRPNTLLIGLKITREKLDDRVRGRVDTMIDKGLEQEVKKLAEKYSWDCEALKGIGYREWRLFFEGSQNIEQTKARIIKSTLDLAKRQRTWFKRNKSIQWIAKQREAVDITTTFLNNNQ